MLSTDMNKALLVTLLLTILPVAYADQGSFTNSGGAASGSSGISTSGSTVSGPAGTLSLNCPSTGPDSFGGGISTWCYYNCIANACVFYSGDFDPLGQNAVGLWNNNSLPFGITGTVYVPRKIKNSPGLDASLTELSSVLRFM